MPRIQYSPSIGTTHDGSTVVMDLQKCSIWQRDCRCSEKPRPSADIGSKEMRFSFLIGCLVGILGVVHGAVANAGEVVIDSAPSPALGRSMGLAVYLPDGYKDSVGLYPVVYLLHGAGDDENIWRTKGGAVETLDALINRGQIRPVVAIMPTAGPGSWWTNGAAEKAETAFVDDLRNYIEGRYKVSRDRKDRMIGGLSMGGYGALNVSLRHPELYCGAAVISPAIYDPLPPETSAARRTPQFTRDGQFDPTIWRALNYSAHLDAYKSGAPRVAMWIASGDHDKFGIAPMAATLYWRLFQIQRNRVELRIVDGDHEWMVFRDALPDALRYIDKQCRE